MPPSSSTCENESGCICKGATLAVAVDGPVADVGRFDFWPSLTLWRRDLSQTDEFYDTCLVRAWRSSVSAGTVRALLQILSTLKSSGHFLLSLLVRPAMVATASCPFLYRQ